MTVSTSVTQAELFGTIATSVTQFCQTQRDHQQLPQRLPLSIRSILVDWQIANARRATRQTNHSSTRSISATSRCFSVWSATPNNLFSTSEFHRKSFRLRSSSNRRLLRMVPRAESWCHRRGKGFWNASKGSSMAVAIAPISSVAGSSIYQKLNGVWHRRAANLFMVVVLGHWAE